MLAMEERLTAQITNLGRCIDQRTARIDQRTSRIGDLARRMTRVGERIDIPAGPLNA